MSCAAHHRSAADQVATGQLWRSSQDKLCLIMTPLTDQVFNVAFWDEGDELGGSSTQVTMIAAEVLLADARLIASPLPALVAMIEQAVSDVSGGRW